MKRMIGFVGAAAAMALCAPAQAQSGNGPASLFQCGLRNGKTVSVTAQGGNFFYAYGRGNRRELSLRGSARSGTVFQRLERYYAIALQIRFTNGQNSYIVHSLPPSRTADAQGSSGVIVMRGDRVIARHACRRPTEFQNWNLVTSLPEDQERWLAMSID
jgi:hypothetical protein